VASTLGQNAARNEPPLFTTGFKGFEVTVQRRFANGGSS
jgi:hypothetical protein